MHTQSPSATAKRIAVIGSGISGLSAAWLLSKEHHVTLFEKDGRRGGHTNTVDVEMRGQTIPVDTGFIVYNPVNYPNLVALFDHLGVTTAATDMSFAVSTGNGAFEYAGSDLLGLLAQPRNILRPRFWAMLRDIRRFYREAQGLLSNGPSDVSLGDYLARGGYSRTFIDDHLIPMGAAIWSTPAERMLDYPAASFIRFCGNHGLLQISGRPQWRTVCGGARTYVKELLKGLGQPIQTASGAKAITRGGGGVVVQDCAGRETHFDDVVIATHADQALALITDPSPAEQALLAPFKYQKNRALLHSDRAFMPRRRAAWASWNYLSGGRKGGGRLCVTYWMNRLQHIDQTRPLFVTLNSARTPSPGTVHAAFDYEHPIFDQATDAAQRQLWSLQGRRNTWFCGAYFGWGFHEDGLQAGLAVAEDLGGVRRPWTLENESYRIHRTAKFSGYQQAAQ